MTRATAEVALELRARCGHSGGAGRDISSSTTTLDLLGDERVLNRLLVELIEEQKRRDKGVVLFGQRSDQHHRSELLVQLVKAERGGSKILNQLYSFINSIDEALERLILEFANGEEVIVGIEATTSLLLEVGALQGGPHGDRAILA